jgi:hypothetical protein
MGTKFSEWAEGQKANEAPAQAELRRRFEAGFALGLQFTEARQARGLTQRQLSEITGRRPSGHQPDRAGSRVCMVVTT